MSTSFNRAVVGRLSRSRSDTRWLLRALRRHIRRQRDSAPFHYEHTRSFRLAFGQFLLCGAHDRPIKTIVAPVLALLLYLATVAYHVFWK